MPTEADRLAHLRRSAEKIRMLAERADRTAIDRLLARPDATDQLDAPTLDFLRQAHDLVCSTTQALTTALENAKPTCNDAGQPTGVPSADLYLAPLCADSRTPAGSQPLDTADAWHRAHLRLPHRHDAPILIHIREFEDGYQAIPISVPIPDPPPIPTVETATTLVIDKSTGTVTRWPLLPLDTLARLYRRYQQREPMTFGDQPQQH
ncbi:hypothetical protein AB0H37_34800 [Actinomadura sp. NPDC023710]|uniref:hypothetical protein n=1 Tax=Actinomadura sp. NPDC023710 TaxID=3158219 RepID=UPI0033C0552E